MLVFALSFWLGALFFALKLSLWLCLTVLVVSFVFPAVTKQACLGFCLGWSYLFLVFFLSFPPLNESSLNQWVEVKGVVQSLITVSKHRQQFYFSIKSLNGKPFKQTVLGSFYQMEPTLKPGEQFLFSAKLKPIRGLKNPGSRDREKESLAKGVRLKGTFKKPIKLTGSSSFSFENIRQGILKKLDKVKIDKRYFGVIESLSLGYKENLGREQKEVFRKTGTSHLMAIYGLHVGLIAAAAFFTVKKLWCLSSFLCLWFPAPRAASIIALAFSFFFAGLTGFAVSTKRALIMLTVFLLAKGFSFKISNWNSFAIALVLVIILSPFSVLGVGFYLSFYAVFVLLLSTSGRGIVSFSKLQVVLLVALSPLSLFYFSYVSLSSIPANLIAIPMVAWVLLPLVLIAVLMVVIVPSLGSSLLLVADKLIFSLFSYLKWIIDFNLFSLNDIHLTSTNLIISILAVILFLIPRQLFLWPLSFVFILPVLFPKPFSVKDKQAFVNVFDVGQGSAILIRTQNHTVLYDAGPKWYGGGDAARSVILPYLTINQIKKIDKLIISHQDIDHRGGEETLKNDIQVIETINNEKRGKETCFNYPAWSYDGVNFSFFKDNRWFNSQNNRSCLLMVSVGKNRFFLTGDIEKSVEDLLIKKHKGALQANYLMAPHHGSNSSSTKAFIDQVSPKVVMFSTGFLNRFKFPRKEVLARYEGISSLNTAESGMISFTISKQYEKPNSYSRHTS